jgi:hypothetical protein
VPAAFQPYRCATSSNVSQTLPGTLNSPHSPQMLTASNGSLFFSSGSWIVTPRAISQSVTRRRAGRQGRQAPLRRDQSLEAEGICRAIRLRHRLARFRPRDCAEIQGGEPFHRILVVRF